MFGWLAGFLKNAQVYIIAGLALLAGWFYLDSKMTHAELATQAKLAGAWQSISEAQERLRVREDRITRASNEAAQAIQEAPNADELVSPDVASAWANAIDSVRNAAADTSDKHDDVQGPSSSTSK